MVRAAYILKVRAQMLQILCNCKRRYLFKLEKVSDEFQPSICWHVLVKCRKHIFKGGNPDWLLSMSNILQLHISSMMERFLLGTAS